MSDPILPAANLPREARALLIAIAQGESDPVAAQEGISPYVILVGGGSMDMMPNRQGYSGFPDWPGRQFSTGISHAAGRYQFQPATWRDTVEMFSAASIPNFRNPGDQDWGAWLLAQHDYKSRTNASLLAVLRANAIGNLGSILKPTWASLSDATFPARYAAALAVVPVDHPPPLETSPSLDDLIAAVQTSLDALKAYAAKEKP